jgi:hypothetical protein
VEIIITFIKGIIASFALIMIIRSALKLVTAGGNEEQSTTHRKSLMYSVGGLLLIYIGEIFIDNVFYKVDAERYNGIREGAQVMIDAQRGVEEIAGITNLIVTFMAPVAVIMLIIGAVMYATAAGSEEQMDKAKRLVIAVFIGIVIIFGAFAIVSTVINSKLADIGVLAVGT